MANCCHATCCPLASSCSLEGGACCYCRPDSDTWMEAAADFEPVETDVENEAVEL